MKRISLRKTPMKTGKNDVIELNPQLTNDDNGDANRDVQAPANTTACKVKSIVKKNRHKKSAVSEALVRKAIESKISLNIIEEVFLRGVSSWNNTMKHDRIQNGFGRVNSYISEGKARIQDNDLQEKVLDKLKRILFK